MTSIIMPEIYAIAQHLSYSPPNSIGIQIKSGFSGILMDARKATNRDQNTGAKIPGSGHESWLGAVGYMILVDQVGSSFRPKGGAAISGSSFSKALKHFSNLSQCEVDALYALRCAFAHDYSLYNIPNSTRMSSSRRAALTHRFEIRANSVSPLVELPSPVAWDGDLTNQVAGTETKVNLEAFADLVEDICTQLINLARQNQLEVSLSGGSDELLQRYSIFIRPAIP